jgi:hypothetical protein
MMLGFFDAILPRDDQRKAGTKPVHTGLDIVGMFDAADVDHNAGLDPTEASGNELLKKYFSAIDRNGDGLLQLGEILTAIQAMSNRR